MNHLTVPKVSAYDGLAGRAVGSIVGDPHSQRGRTRPMYIPLDEDEEDDLDVYVDILLTPDTEEKIYTKIGGNYSGGVDSYKSRGSSRYNVGGNIVAEFAGDHRNTARKGISPFKQPKHSGPPLGTGSASQVFRTTGPYKRTGTQYGSSRPHKLLTDIEDDNIFNLSDMVDAMERSYMRRNRVKKTLARLKEYLEM